MGKWKHKLRKLNTLNRTAICEFCGPVRIKRRGAKGWRCYKGHKEKDNYKPVYKRKAPGNPGACSICGQATKLVYDHDHITNQFRGWICQLCNSGLGMFKDNPIVLQNAIDYLIKSKGP